VVYFKPVIQNSRGGNEEKREYLSQGNRYPGSDSKQISQIRTRNANHCTVKSGETKRCHDNFQAFLDDVQKMNA